MVVMVVGGGGRRGVVAVLVSGGGWWRQRDSPLVCGASMLRDIRCPCSIKHHGYIINIKNLNLINNANKNKQ